MNNGKWRIENARTDSILHFQFSILNYYACFPHLVPSHTQYGVCVVYCQFCLGFLCGAGWAPTAIGHFYLAFVASIFRRHIPICCLALANIGRRAPYCARHGVHHFFRLVAGSFEFYSNYTALGCRRTIFHTFTMERSDGKPSCSSLNYAKTHKEYRPVYLGSFRDYIGRRVHPQGTNCG